MLFCFVLFCYSYSAHVVNLIETGVLLSGARDGRQRFRTPAVVDAVTCVGACASKVQAGRIIGGVVVGTVAYTLAVAQTSLFFF